MNTDPLSDASLIARVITQQDPHAFRQLVLRHQSSVRRWARRLCDGDDAAADDLAQEVFIKVYRALPTYRGEARFSTWLYRVAFNLAASQKRLARERWQAVDLEQAGEEIEQVTGSMAAGEWADASRDLSSAMEALSQAQQWALRLSLEEGLTQEEVAEVMALPLGTVKTHIRRGKQALQSLLSDWREVTS